MVEPWHTKGLTPKKDAMMDMTEENFARVIAMRDELIFEQKAEISKLQMSVNTLRQRLQCRIARDVSKLEILNGSKKVNNV